MTWDTFERYFKTMAGGGLILHFLINFLLLGWILGYHEVMSHFLPISGPVFLLGMAWGWWLVFEDRHRVVEKATKQADQDVSGN